MSDLNTPPGDQTRFDRNDRVYMAGLLILFAGLANLFSIGAALAVIGGIVIFVSVASSFFVTWLSTQVQKH